MSFFGFFFWMINARLFTTEQVGLATTMISTMSLITSFSILGLNSGLIRYLPKAHRKNDVINTVFSVTSTTTIILTLIFILGLSLFSVKLLFIRENIFNVLIFILFILFSNLGNLIDSIFIALRDTKFILAKNLVFSIVKLFLPFILMNFGTYGIFGSLTIALTMALIFSLLIMIKNFKYYPQFIINKSVIKKIGRFSFGIYINSFLDSLPSMILPLMVLNMIGTQSAAYYYMATIIANLLYIIPQAVSASFFAEGSHNENNIIQHAKKSSKIIALFLIPAIVIMVFFGKYILIFFGKEYSTAGFRLLQILALSGIFMSINSIFSTILLVQHKIITIIYISLLNVVITLVLSYLFISHGLQGIGMALIAGQAAATLVYSGLAIKRYVYKLIKNN